jgi:hypothetical protein
LTSTLNRTVHVRLTNPTSAPIRPNHDTVRRLLKEKFVNVCVYSLVPVRLPLSNRFRRFEEPLMNFLHAYILRQVSERRRRCPHGNKLSRSTCSTETHIVIPFFNTFFKEVGDEIYPSYQPFRLAVILTYWCCSHFHEVVPQFECKLDLQPLLLIQVRLSRCRM